MSVLHTSRVRLLWVAWCWLLLTCATSIASAADALGGRFVDQEAKIKFCVFSSRATRHGDWMYGQALGEDEKLGRPLLQDAETHHWSTTVSVADLQASGVTGTIYY